MKFILFTFIMVSLSACATTVNNNYKGRMVPMAQFKAPKKGFCVSSYINGVVYKCGEIKK